MFFRLDYLKIIVVSRNVSLPRGGEIHTITSFDIKRLNVLHGDDSCSGST